MLHRLAPMLIMLAACNSTRSVSVDGKTVTLGASAAVRDCPKCRTCPGRPPQGAKTIKWNYASDAGFVSLLPAGGSIPTDEPGWACSYSAMWRVSGTEDVEGTCKYGATSVKHMVSCDFWDWWHGSALFDIGEHGHIMVACQAQDP